jgi:hypothetical protein
LGYLYAIKAAAASLVEERFTTIFSEMKNLNFSSIPLKIFIIQPDQDSQQLPISSIPMGFLVRALGRAISS